jgi:hypothetical protein
MLGPFVFQHSPWINTMLRCALLAATLALAAALPALAQTRNFPATALRGDFTVSAAPEVVLNKQAARLAPGARIRGANNLLLLPASITNQRLLVNYTLDLHGQILDVWVLTPAEAAKKPWPASPQEAAAWSFNPDQQVWIKP